MCFYLKGECKIRLCYCCLQTVVIQTKSFNTTLFKIKPLLYDLKFFLCDRCCLVGFNIPREVLAGLY